MTEKKWMPDRIYNLLKILVYVLVLAAIVLILGRETTVEIWREDIWPWFTSSSPASSPPS